MDSTEKAVEKILLDIGEDPTREGLVRTPHRVAKAYKELTAGYHMNVEDIINDAMFTVKYNEMVVVTNIEFYSLCEHHLLPFFGQAHIAYIPNEKVVGLSKIPRIVEMFARRLQVQEQMTQEIAETINNTLNPQGVGVVIKGHHMCMSMRGVRKEQAQMTTSALLGTFSKNPATRNEFMHIVTNAMKNK
ncbi:MAG: GTP cyclohydrolase I FolE [Lentisphaeraceae bacterium]|nr:GTP cyclohydrolase I FolE [Lentisphaeraceae bacterium]